MRSPSAKPTRVLPCASKVASLNGVSGLSETPAAPPSSAEERNERATKLGRIVPPGLSPIVAHSARLLVGGYAGLHSFQHVVGEEEFAVIRHHHDLHFIRQLFGDDLLNEQRVFLQDYRFEFEP